MPSPSQIQDRAYMLRLAVQGVQAVEPKQMQLWFSENDRRAAPADLKAGVCIILLSIAKGYC
jgi:hypothetical protein